MADLALTFFDKDVVLRKPPTDLLDQPLPFIESNQQGDFVLNEDTCKLLSKVNNPVVVVGIAGVYRSGKSYLMNLLAGNRRTGFELGSTVESKTKGIWIWCRPHPQIPNTTLILMDTEGLDDADNGDDNRDMQIIVLTLLLSSTFIYNTGGRVDNGLIRQLGFVSELTKHIQVRVGQEVENDSDFDVYFPVLVVTVRDFTLQLQIGGEKVTAGEYFEHCLSLKKTTTEPKRARLVHDYNEPRIKIRKYFPQRKRHCFVLPVPVKRFCTDWLSSLALLPKEDINPEFLTKCAEYQKLIFDVSREKNFGHCDRVNGRMFIDMAASYITALSSGQLPCIQSALKMTADNENQRLMKECVSKYEAKTRLLDLPLPLEELTTAHGQIVEEIINEYKDKLIFEEAGDFRTEFEKHLESAYNLLVKLNEEMSRRKCEKVLESLNENMKSRSNEKVYLRPGGYEIYMRDLNNLTKQYKMVNRKSVKSHQVLHEFLQRKESEISNIIAIDREMTTGKVKEETEKRLRKDIERREKMLQREVESAKKREDSFQRSLKESALIMEDEWQARLRQQCADFERIMTDRQQNYDQMVSELQHEINTLKYQLACKPEIHRSKCTIL